MSPAELTAAIANLFANYDVERIDVDRDEALVVLTVLRLGSWEQTRALFGYYGRDAIRAVFAEDFFGHRTLPVSVRVFWANFFFGDRTVPERVDPMERWRPTRLVPEGVTKLQGSSGEDVPPART